MRKSLTTFLILVSVLLTLPQGAFASIEPTVTITFDKECVAIGEPITATYKIEGGRTYSEIQWHCTMWISDDEGQSRSDGDNTLNKTEGSITFIPRFGEAVSVSISFVDETGRWYDFRSEKIPTIGYSTEKPSVTITFDKKSVAIGEPITATYEIEGSGAYSEIQWYYTMWISQDEGQSKSDGDNTLNNTKGSVTYIPKYGEAISFSISFIDETGRWYDFRSEKIPVLGYSVEQPTVTFILDKETVGIGETVTAEYKIEGNGTYSEIQWHCTMWVSENEGQSRVDSDNTLNGLSGSITYIPRFGEAISFSISLVDETERWYDFRSKKIPINGFADEYEIYSVTEGQDTQISTGEMDLTFRANGDFEKFLGIQVDNKYVPNNVYDAWPGSTYVELSAEYLASLPEGEHELIIVFEDGVAVTKFGTAKNIPELPQTGDESNIALYMTLMAFSAACLIVMAKRRRTE